MARSVQRSIVSGPMVRGSGDRTRAGPHSCSPSCSPSCEVTAWVCQIPRASKNHLVSSILVIYRSLFLQVSVGTGALLCQILYKHILTDPRRGFLSSCDLKSMQRWQIGSNPSLGMCWRPQNINCCLCLFFFFCHVFI